MQAENKEYQCMHGTSNKNKLQSEISITYHKMRLIPDLPIHLKLIKSGSEEDLSQKKTVFSKQNAMQCNLLYMYHGIHLLYRRSQRMQHFYP
jgi:hypothetical protein